MMPTSAGDARLTQSNLEFKARVTDHGSLEAVFEKMGAAFVGVLDQTDTYFKVNYGRLKLRESDVNPPELILYDRNESSSECMESHYEIVKVFDPKIKEILVGALGVKTVVNKQRRLYKWKNARIHLDNVKRLGKFIEFEVVSPEGTLHEKHDYAEDSQTLEALKKVAASYVEEEINCSYSDLMLSDLSTPAV